MNLQQGAGMKVGIDVGGTFTDLILTGGETGETQATKTFSTVSPAEGILTALKKIKVPLAEVSTFVFGSTIATNALVQRKYSRVGTISTQGFRDTLEIRRIWREHLFGSFWERPEGMVPRKLRREVAGRVNVDGFEVSPLDTEQLIKEVKFLQQEGVESVAISFLHSHVNPLHEILARDVIKENFPDLVVSISSEESPEVGEYERISTTVVAAALKPLISRELDRLVTDLRSEGLSGSIHVMKSNGGVMSVEAAQRKPHELVQSGPSGGVAAARKWGNELGVQNLITLDVGGTTADISLIRDGRATVERQVELDWDIPVRVSLVDIKSVGAGGGSIAWVDAAGLPRLGPASAGSTPGPACLNRGGTKTTITDAALLAGWLNGKNFADGEVELDINKSKQAMANEGLPEALKVTTDGDAGAGILALGVNIIAEQIRALTVKHGVDPRDFSLLVYGGAGGLFGADVAEALGIERVILPPNSSVLSAWGGLLADEEHDYSRTVLKEVTSLSVQELQSFAQSMMSQANQDFGDSNFHADFMLDMRYDGQTHVLTVPIGQSVTQQEIALASTAFENLHEQRYGHHRPEDAVEITTVRLHAHRSLMLSDGSLEGTVSFVNNSTEQPKVPARMVHRYSKTCKPWNVERREQLCPGYSKDGPVIVEDGSSTIMVPEKWDISVGIAGELNLRMEGKKQ